MSIEIINGDDCDKYLEGIPLNCRFELPSGRVILLTEQFTDEELQAARHPQMVAILERMADEFVRRSTEQN